MALAPKNQRKRFGKGELLQEAPLQPVSDISSCLNKLKKSWERNGSLAGIWENWSELAGSQLSKNCQPISLRRGILTIGASHPQWRQALQYNRSQLLATIKAAGHEIRELKIQQHHPGHKKEKGESEKNIWDKHPSRVDIHGMATCNICKRPSPAGEIALWDKCSFCRRKELFE